MGQASKVNRENYITIQGWMVTDLQLKGNELMIYAIIYGFSQLESQKYSGSRQYLAEWTNSTKRGVTKCLQSLAEKGLICREERVINGVKFCDYWCTKFTGGGEQSSLGGGEQSSPHNIDIDNIAIYTRNKYIVEIVEYLNARLGTKYRAQTAATQRLIGARLNEDYTVDDFKAVIDKQYKRWHGTSMETYLRPETLFGTKFEGYLNASDAPSAKTPAIDETMTDLDDLF